MEKKWRMRWPHSVSTAFVDRTGIINPDIVIESLGEKAERPSIPNWIAKWIEAENNRPWPPDKE